MTHPQQTGETGRTLAVSDGKIITALKFTANELPEGKHRQSAFDALHLIGRLLDQIAAMNIPDPPLDQKRTAFAQGAEWAAKMADFLSSQALNKGMEDAAEVLAKAIRGAVSDAAFPPAAPPPDRPVQGGVPDDPVFALIDAERELQIARALWNKPFPEIERSFLEECRTKRNAVAAALRSLLARPDTRQDAGGTGDGFQASVRAQLDVITEGDPSSLEERRDRFTEESLELAQSLGADRGRVIALVDYVFGRPVGEPEKEVGGVKTTLAALCSFAGLDMAACGWAELRRCWQPEVMARIRRKRASRHGRGALPGVETDSTPPAQDAQP